MKIYESNPMVWLALAVVRMREPRRRFLHLFYWVRNGSQVAQMGCALCEDCGPTWCNAWKKTKLASDWEVSHRAEHIKTLGPAAMQQEKVSAEIITELVAIENTAPKAMKKTALEVDAENMESYNQATGWKSY